MTRTEKIERIKKYRYSLYIRLRKKVPYLLANPENAEDEDIAIYNILIAEEAKRDNNNTVFKKNFSF